MPTYDPRIISRSIEALESEIQRFTDTSRETSRQAGYTQANYRERADRVLRWSALVLNNALNNTIEVQNLNDEVDRLLIQCHHAVDTAHQTLNQSENIRDRSISTQNRWRGELHQAQLWEAHAAAELDLAISDRNQAQASVSAASYALSRAESALSSCRSNSKNNCSGQSAGVNSAQQQLNTATAELALAEARVDDAEAEFARARARVNHCQNSLQIADVAVARSNIAVNIAIDSLGRAEASLSDANTAQRATTQAHSKAIEAEEYARETAIRSRRAESNVDTAQSHLYRSIQFNDSAHNLAIRAKIDLDYRNEQLRQFNRPSSDIP